MNEIEQAIKAIENIAEYWTCRPSERQAAQLALIALREQVERGKGCEWCKVGQNNARTVWIDGSFDAFTGDSYGEGASHKGIIDRKVAYCPMCGRWLGVESIDAGTIGGEMVQWALKKLEGEP